MIPEQLKNPKFRFIKIDPNKKKPSELNWTKTANYQYDNETLTKWFEKGGNYGVACGFGDLIVIDSDTQELQDLVEKELPETFTIKTGGGGYHNYYILPNQKKIIFEKGNKHLGELQAQGQQVVGPNSTHPSGNKYSVIKDIPITTLNNGIIYEKIPKEYFKGSEKEETKTMPKRPINGGYELNILDVVPMNNLRKKANGEYQGPHPIHSKVGEDNDFTVNPSKNVWHCFWHNCGGTPLDWIAIQEGIIHCGDKLDKKNFKKTIKAARDKYHYQEHSEEEINKLLESKNYGQLKKIISEKLLAKDRDSATELLVKQVEKEEHIYTIIDDERPEMWIYDEGIYIQNGESKIIEKSRIILEELSSSHLVNRVVFKIQSDTFIDQEKFFDNIIKDEIVTENGVLNLCTRELREYSPEPIFFTKIPVKYNPEATCPNIQKFLLEVLKNKEDLPIMQEIFGYLLWKEYNIERAFMFIGSGRNGKGKTMELMKRFIGVNNYSSVALQNLEVDQFSQVDLHNKLANLCGDIDDRALKFTSSFKNLTGRDTISANRKFKTILHFENFAKLIFAANQLPKTADISDGFFMRWILIEFPFTFVSEEEYDNLTDVIQVGKSKIRDPNIIDSIATEEELSGLLNWALDGLDRLQKQKDFTHSRSLEAVKSLWIRKSDSFHAFCMDTLEECYGNEIQKAEIRHVYNEYCKKHKLKPVTDRDIKDELAGLFGVYEAKTTLDDTRVHVWVGIKYKPPVENQGQLDIKSS